MSGLQKMFSLLWDSEPCNNDHANPLVCLGEVYDPVSGYQSITSLPSYVGSDSPEMPGDESSIVGCPSESDLLDDSSGILAAPSNSLYAPTLPVVTSLPLSPENGPRSNSTISLPLSSSSSYDSPRVPTSALTSSTTPPPSNGWPGAFLSDVQSRIWMTYRTGFPLIPKSKTGPSTIKLSSILRGGGMDLNGYTSDVGWGCMIRTAQCLLANTLQIQYLGRQWRWPMSEKIITTTTTKTATTTTTITNKSTETYYNTDEGHFMTWFADNPQKPFSVHRFVDHGYQHDGKMPGEWFGPSAAASSIKGLVDDHNNNNSKIKLHVYYNAISGGDIYEIPLRQLATNQGTTAFEPILILCTLRLGIDNVNPIYWDSLKQLLATGQSVGIAGGRPSSSHYFFGYQGDYLFYLDPHMPRVALKIDDDDKVDLTSVHTDRIRKLHLRQMDPSMLVGFLIRDEGEWCEWKARIQGGDDSDTNTDMNKNYNSNSQNKIIHIFDTDPTAESTSDQWDGSSESDSEDETVFDKNEDDERLNTEERETETLHPMDSRDYASDEEYVEVGSPKMENDMDKIKPAATITEPTISTPTAQPPCRQVFDEGSMVFVHPIGIKRSSGTWDILGSSSASTSAASTGWDDDSMVMVRSEEDYSREWDDDF